MTNTINYMTVEKAMELINLYVAGQEVDQYDLHIAVTIVSNYIKTHRRVDKGIIEG